jgi:hypothetical protein
MVMNGDAMPTDAQGKAPKRERVLRFAPGRGG